MSEKRWFPGEWVPLPMRPGIAFLKPGYYAEGDVLPSEAYTHELHANELNQLIAFLHKNGYIKPQLGENRTEDIKIIHRLLDVVEKR